MSQNKIITLLLSILLVFPSCAHKSGHHGVNPETTVDTQTQDEESEDVANQNESGRHTRVEMRKDGGVYLVPINVNGLNLDFVFDTGASSISISAAEATVMVRQGKITQNDIVGEAQFSDANGDVSVGTVVNLRAVQIGDITLHNIEASVVDNMQAPLLLGQTALAKFGKVTIDYDNGYIEFN